MATQPASPTPRRAVPREKRQTSQPSERGKATREARGKLARTCRRQFGVFTVDQAAAAGLKRGAIYNAVERGIFVKLWPGVLAVAGTPDGRNARWMAAQLFIGGDAVLSHQTAADIHGLEHGVADDRIHLTVFNRRPTTRAGLVVHRSPTLFQDGVSTVGPLRVTSATRTLCDLAAEVDAERLRRLVGAAVRGGESSAALLRKALERRRQFPGRTALRTIIEELSPLEPLSRSELESLFLRVTTRAGIPPTSMNLRVVDANGRTRYLDAVYLPEGVIVELDSRKHHGTLLDWHDDLRRENSLALVGYRVCLRFSHADLRDRPDEVIATIRRALDIAREQHRKPGGA